MVEGVGSTVVKQTPLASIIAYRKTGIKKTLQVQAVQYLQ